MGFLFRKHKSQVNQQQEHMADAMCSTCAIRNIQFRQEEKPMLEQTKSEQAKVVARINISFDVDKPKYRNIYEHDLMTFDIDPDDISLLNALHLDVAFHCACKDNGYLSMHDQMEWLAQTHAYSSRTIDADMFCRWDSLMFLLTTERM